MIKFFRYIRKDLMEKNKTGNYLKYAIGEIILVVIGILIALQINNMNEARKTKNFEHKILNDILISMEGNFFQLDLCLKSNKGGIASGNIISRQLEENLPYHDSLARHFSRSIQFCSPALYNAGYESLKTYGRNLITKDAIRKSLGIYDSGWMETVAQRQEDYFFYTATPVLTNLFEKVAMRTEMKPFDYDELKNSKAYISVLKTSMANREDQIYWYEQWKDSLVNIKEIIEMELEKQ